jgi:hypothetical protein
VSTSAAVSNEAPLSQQEASAVILLMNVKWNEDINQ